MDNTTIQDTLNEKGSSPAAALDALSRGPSAFKEKAAEVGLECKVLLGFLVRTFPEDVTNSICNW